MPKGMNIVNQEFDKPGDKGAAERINSPHARETKAHISAENSTSPHKPKKQDFGHLGSRPSDATG